jgi:hypothetical protein
VRVIDLSFRVAGARAEPLAVTPTLMFQLQIREASSRAIHAILLRCQLRIEPRRRRHSSDEQERLEDMFGEPSRWADTVRPVMWTQTTMNVPAFEGSIELDLPVACTYDFEVTSAKYLAAIDDGEVPLRLLFSGTVFVKTDTGFLVQQIPWDKEASWRMPISVWRNLMDLYFPGCAWIRLRRENLDLLQRYRAKQSLTSWDEAIETLLAQRS